MADSISGGLKISNVALLVLIATLGTGILLDGRAYNKPTPMQAIYPLKNTASIEVHFDQQLILEFKKNKQQQWLQSTPIAAPALQQRVEVLLDTNKHGQRYYSSTTLPLEDIFKDSITLKIDSATYEFGSVEPVSKLRYVLADDRVYLQPDSVIPLLSGASNAFIDLKITEQVESISIGNTPVTQPDLWSNLTAIDVTPKSAILSDAGLKINLVQNGKTLTLTAVRSGKGYVISSENGFDYTLSAESANSLGLEKLLTSSNP